MESLAVQALQINLRDRGCAEAARYIAARAEARGMPVARIHRAMRARGWSSMVTDFAADWFHPNDRGHRLWADAFGEAIEGTGILRPVPGRGPGT